MTKMSYKILNVELLIIAILNFLCMSSFAAQIDEENLSAAKTIPIKDFELNYIADFNGLEIKGVHKLTEVDKGQYKELFEARGVLGKVTEVELFDINSNQQIIPRENTYRRSLIGTKRTEKQQYDWSTNEATYKKGNKVIKIALQPGYLDSMSHKQQLRRDIAAGEDYLTYAVISRGKLKQYTYKVIATEILKTPIGPLNTTVVQRFSDDKTKTTKVWLATDWDYIMVRLERSDKGDTQEMQFTGGQSNKQMVKPLEIGVEK